MKTKMIPEICRKMHFHPTKAIEMERQLSDLAAEGMILTRINGSDWYFVKGAPVSCQYLLLDPQKGTDSEMWVIFELERLGGERLLCESVMFASPAYAIVLPQDTLIQNREMIQYYYYYRNYRLARRLVESVVVYLTVAVLCFVIGALASFQHLIALLPWVLLFAVLANCRFFAMLRFSKSCGADNWKSLLKKPRRPGY